MLSLFVCAALSAWHQLWLVSPRPNQAQLVHPTCFAAATKLLIGCAMGPSAGADAALSTKLESSAAVASRVACGATLEVLGLAVAVGWGANVGVGVDGRVSAGVCGFGLEVAL